MRSRVRPTQDQQRNDYVKRLEDSIQQAYTRFLATQAPYNRDFDKRIRTIRQRIKAGDYVCMDPTDGKSKTGKLRSPAIGPYRVLRKDDRTYVIDRDRAIERINADRVTYAPSPEDPKDRHETATEQHDIDKTTEGPS